MKYLLLINAPETLEANMTQEEMGTLMAGYGRFSEELVAAGAMVDGQRLQPTNTATTVRVRDGEAVVSDGPFAETKEQFGGFYVIEAPDLDSAIAWARKIPSVEHGSIEIRPIWEMEGDSAAAGEAALAELSDTA